MGGKVKGSGLSHGRQGKGGSVCVCVYGWVGCHMGGKVEGRGLSH